MLSLGDWCTLFEALRILTLEDEINTLYRNVGAPVSQ
jgi:hypothetical protein